MPKECFYSYRHDPSLVAEVQIYMTSPKAISSNKFAVRTFREIGHNVLATIQNFENVSV